MHEAESLPKRVVAAFGGLSKTARALRHKSVTTVDGWVQAGTIPHWRFHEIREAAARENVALPEDFPNPGPDPAERLVPRYGTP